MATILLLNQGKDPLARHGRALAVYGLKPILAQFSISSARRQRKETVEPAS